ncbi:pseudoazurin [Paracoccus onubensis]|uniref:Pseudoazurin n=1 Tax=Paracoccus onubensis TaxID=1675788 RepID=A0A418SY48_9RHOB|nr:pseudoazurin [Paracoccus onubensis]RJE85884.1 pseudoazurin [Paracoccus onubensis]
MRFLTFIALLLAHPAAADVFEVRMLNRNDTGGMVFEPEYLELKSGDRIKFLATHPSHNAASMPEMLPENAEPFKGQINEEIEVEFTEPGFYGIKCIPHYTMGMVMLVQVGEQPVSSAEIPDDLPDHVTERLTRIVERAQTGNGI